MNKTGRRIGIAGAVVGLGAAGVGTAVLVRKYAVGRVRLSPDLYADEPFGALRGRSLTVLADDGVPLHTEIDGPDDAPLTVVFCHGYALNQDSWHFQRKTLADERGLRRVFWDQRGHGRSGRGVIAHTTIDQAGRDLNAVLRATVPAGEPVVLVGHSMGGMTIMALADQRPELFDERVVGVALINTSTGKLAEVTLGLPAIAGRVAHTAVPGVVRGLGKRAKTVDRGRRLGADLAFMVTRRIGFADKQVSPTIVDFLERMIRATPIDVIAEFYPSLLAHDKFTALDVLGKVPALVVVGDSDRLTPPQHGRAVAAGMPDAELVQVADGGHAVMLEHPGIVNQALHRLLARIRPGVQGRTP